MAGEVRPIAMGVGGIKFGTVGDGVPGADLKDYPLPTKGSVAFNFADPKEVKIEADWGIEQIHGRQLFPARDHGDGFYYCRIQKTA